MGTHSKFEAHYFVFPVLIALFIAINLNNWRELKGVLLANWIVYETTEGEVFRSGTGIIPTGYSSLIGAEIEYGYRVDGEIYVSDLVDFANDIHEVERYRQRYPLGKRVKVYYEKGNPSFAVLEPENWSFKTIQGTFLITLSFVIYLFSWLLCHRYQWCGKLVTKFGYEFTGND